MASLLHDLSEILLFFLRSDYIWHHELKFTFFVTNEVHWPYSTHNFLLPSNSTRQYEFESKPLVITIPQSPTPLLGPKAWRRPGPAPLPPHSSERPDRIPYSPYPRHCSLGAAPQERNRKPIFWILYLNESLHFIYNIFLQIECCFYLLFLFIFIFCLFLLCCLYVTFLFWSLVFMYRGCCKRGLPGLLFFSVVMCGFFFRFVRHVFIIVSEP